MEREKCRCPLSLERFFFFRCELVGPFVLVHNTVNRRLHEEQHEDPKFPKVQFPPSTMCGKCRSTTTDTDDPFALPETIEFLQRFYAKENIDLSMVQKSIDVEGRAEALKNDDDGTIVRSSSIFHSSSFYFLFAFVIIVILIRKRHCKSKIKRYTL